MRKAFFISKKTVLTYIEYDYKGRKPIPTVEVLLFEHNCERREARRIKGIIFEAIKKGAPV
jgi:hypothetical protein